MKALLLFLLLTTPVSASLAETLNECVQRYGQPSKIDEGKNMVIFRKSDLLVICTFHAEKCESISYAKESKEEFSEAEFEVYVEPKFKNCFPLQTTSDLQYA